MKKTILIITAIAATTGLSQAALTSLINLSKDDGATDYGNDHTSPYTLNKTTDADLGGIAWSDGAFSGIIDVSFTATAVLADGRTIGRGGKGGFGINNGNTGGESTQTSSADGTLRLSGLTFSFVSGDTPLSIQFGAIYIGNDAGSGETGTINGIAWTNANTGGTTTSAGRNIITATSTVDLDALTGNFTTNGIELQVTAVPEPSSVALLGLGGLALILRRRR